MSAYQNMKDSGVEWIGEIPEHWKVLRGKTFMSALSRPLNEDDEIVTCFRDGEVTLRKNRREDGFTNALKEIGYQGVEPGDLVVHAMDGFAGAIGISDARGKVSPVLNVLDCDQNKRYVMYYLRALAYRDVFSAFSTGIRIRSCDLRWNKLATLPYTIPTLNEQLDIVAYLDSACADIDAAIAEAKASIDDYKLLKQSVITQAVTKGLDPTVPMKDSGVEWIGEIPAHWRIASLFQLGVEVKKKNGNLQEQNLLSLSYGKIKRKDIRASEGLVPATFDGYNVIEAGDIVLRLTDLQNDHTSLRVGRATERGIITSAYTTIRPIDLDMSSYLYYVLHSFDIRKGFYGMGSGVRQGLGFGEAKTLRLPVPPNDERAIIVAHLDSFCSATDAVIAEKQSMISDLESYQKSLIYEVVTGKRKVV